MGPRRTLWATLTLAVALFAPHSSSADVIHSAPYDASASEEACGPLERSCSADAVAEHETGRLAAHLALQSPADGRVPGPGSAWAQGSITHGASLAEPVRAVAVTATIHLDALSLEQDGLVARQGLATASHADFELWVTHDQCQFCSTGDRRTLTTFEKAGDDFVLNGTMSSPDGLLPAGALSMRVTLTAQASLSSLFPVLVADGSRAVDVESHLVSISVNPVPVPTTPAETLTAPFGDGSADDECGAAFGATCTSDAVADETDGDLSVAAELAAPFNARLPGSAYAQYGSSLSLVHRVTEEREHITYAFVLALDGTAFASGNRIPSARDAVLGGVANVWADSCSCNGGNGETLLATGKWVGPATRSGELRLEVTLTGPIPPGDVHLRFAMFGEAELLGSGRTGLQMNARLLRVEVFS